MHADPSRGRARSSYSEWLTAEIWNDFARHGVCALWLHVATVRSRSAHVSVPVFVITFVRTIRWEPGINRLIEQLVDAAGSVGANRQEASSGSSRKEFVRFSEIWLRSATESHFWLRACAATRLGDQQLCTPLVDEADQLVRIFAAIVLSTKNGPPGD